MDLRVITLSNEAAFGHIPIKYRISSERAGPQATPLSNNRRPLINFSLLINTVSLNELLVRKYCHIVLAAKQMPMGEVYK